MLTPFGEWVRAFRESKGITLREMSRALGKSPSFLSAMELGRKSVSTSIAEEIKNAYGLSEIEFERAVRAVHASRMFSKVKFENRVEEKDKEVALLFARNFDDLTDDQTERIRRILEEGNDGSKH